MQKKHIPKNLCRRTGNGKDFEKAPEIISGAIFVYGCMVLLKIIKNTGRLESGNVFVFLPRYGLSFIMHNNLPMQFKKASLKESTSSEKMSTLSSCMNRAAAKGYTVNFKVEKDLLWDSGYRYYKPGEVTIKDFYRFEGESDPADNSILYLITTTDGQKGMLTDAYGAYGDARIAEFVKKVTHIQKQKPEAKYIPPVLYYVAGAIAVSALFIYTKMFRKKTQGPFRFLHNKE